LALNINEVLDTLPQDEIIVNNFIKAWKIINNPDYEKIVCKISGGSDSDDMLDICYKCDLDKKIDYVWFDTGLEYRATIEHLKYLEQKYNFEIKPYKAIKPIPLACKLYGQPFISKRVSDYMHRLQSHNFKWENKLFEELFLEYPKCKTALKWWCNSHKSNSFNIIQNKWLKEFITENPPTFYISDKCCTYAKKKVGNKLIKEEMYDLDIIGVRKSEGGTRATAYKNCFDENDGSCDNYRPLFFYKNDTKIVYENHFNISHSRCYTEYGLKRTGCAGCPFGRDFEFELEVIEKYEPKLYRAVNSIFGKSYEYTRQYREFCKMMNEQEKQNKMK
jgi:3'-phosphoadenosine 5'-phosphosulfate sulfotransferase (PAPS reductase)/FAD synthetase